MRIQVHKPEFKIGDRVQKKLGYPFPGVVVGVFLVPACDGEDSYYYRYDVLASHSLFRGLLHIFNDEQLVIRQSYAELDDEILRVLKKKG